MHWRAAQLVRETIYNTTRCQNTSCDRRNKKKRKVGTSLRSRNSNFEKSGGVINQLPISLYSIPCLHAYPNMYSPRRSLFFLSSLDKNCPSGVAVPQLHGQEKVAVGAFRDRLRDVAWATADAIYETELRQPNIVLIFRRFRNRVTRDKCQKAFPWADNALTQ